MYISLTIGLLLLIFFQNINNQRIFYPGEIKRSCEAGTRCLPRWECAESTDQRLSYCRDQRTLMRQVCCPQISENFEETTSGVETDCGITHSARFVISNKKSKQSTWPWMVAIRKRNRMGELESWCTGFLIDKSHVLTAAHCFDSKGDLRKYLMKIGHVDQRNGTTFYIQKIAIHPDYKTGQNYHDVAMLTLDQSVDLDTVNPICLPTKEMAARNLDGVRSSVAGWETEKFNGNISYTLRELDWIRIIPNRMCNILLNRTFPEFLFKFPKGITKELICAAFFTDGTKRCIGGSGSPLMWMNNGRWYVVGLVSFYFGCGGRIYHAGCIRISEYMDWIKRETLH